MMVHMIRVHMQKQNYTPPDFYISWTKMNLELKKYNHDDLALDMLQGMICYKDTPTVLAGVFIDPRFKVFLSEEQCVIAVKHIKEILERLKQNKEH